MWYTSTANALFMSGHVPRVDQKVPVHISYDCAIYRQLKLACRNISLDTSCCRRNIYICIFIQYTKVHHVFCASTNLGKANRLPIHKMPEGYMIW